MSIYRLDLDALKETRDEYQLSATKAGENIDTSHEVINKTDINIFAGDDANTFRLDFTNYVDNDMQQMQETLFKMKEILTDGLNDARACKKLCNDFVITLGGGGNGKSAEDMQGELYCDQSAINGLKEYCRSALSYSDSIRTICTSINDTLWELVIVKLYPTPYTSAIKEGCDKVDRLEDHSRELGNYAEAAETINDSFESALLVFSAPFISDLTLETYTGSISPQEEAIMKIMEQKDGLSEMDKEILEENLRIMEENGDIEGLQKVAEHSGNKGNGEWTLGDVYVMAHIYNYAENNANAELATAVYDKMKKVDCINSNVDVHANSPHTIFEFEVKLDENKVEDILEELNSEKDGLAYYSLQRRSKYVQRVEKSEVGSNAEEPEVDFEVTFNSENGRLVSVFTAGGESVRLASVDMNEIVGEEGKRNLKSLGYSKEESIALMSSIYTDEDIPFIGELTMAKTEEDYREVFQHDPNLLSVDAKAGLYNYSVALVDKNVSYDENMMITKQDFTRLENFINGMLYRESDRIKFENYEIGGANDWAGDYREEYLESMIMCGETQMDILRYQMEVNYKDVEYVKNNLAWFAENAQILSLYATIDTRMSKCFVYQNNYMKIDGLGLDFVPGENGLSENMNEIMFSYCENIMHDNEAVVKEENGQEIPYTADIKIKKLTGEAVAVEEFSNECARKIKQARYALPKGMIKACTTMIPNYIPYVGEMVDEALGYADLVDNGVSVYEAYREAEEANEKLNQMLSGAQIVYIAKVGKSEVDADIVLGGKYDANALLKMERLENEGLRSFHTVSEDITENSKNLEKDRDASENYLIWVGEEYLKKYKKKSLVNSIGEIDADEIRKKIDDIEELITSDQRINYLDYNILKEFYLGD